MTHTAPEHVRHGAHNDSRVAEIAAVTASCHTPELDRPGHDRSAPDNRHCVDRRRGDRKSRKIVGVLVCDVGHCIEVYADFSGQGKNCAQFPDRQGFRLYLDDLRRDEICDDPTALDQLDFRETR